MMTDFISRVLRPEYPYLPVQSRLDVDIYKPIMGQWISRVHPDVEVTFTLINRSKQIPIADVIPEDQLRLAIEHLFHLPMGEATKTDRCFLRGMDFYDRDLFDDKFLDVFFGPRYRCTYDLRREGSQYKLTFTGPWEEVTYFETQALAVVSELYYFNLMSRMRSTQLSIMFAKATDKLYNKLIRLAAVDGLTFTDFSHRRRLSFLWQKFCVGMAKDVCRKQFVGTSDLYFAFSHNLNAKGTNAHEPQMVLTAIAPDHEKREAQYNFYRSWREMYGYQNGLLMFLPDTYGTESFLSGAPADLELPAWRGPRQDSGDPVDRGNLFLDWYRKQGILNPKKEGKLLLFSDGLDVDPMIDLYGRFGDQINTTFGLGTLFANDFIDCHPNPDSEVPGLAGHSWRELFRPISLVCKVTEADGNLCVKLSDNVTKATGLPSEVEKYKKIFGTEGRVERPVFV